MQIIQREFQVIKIYIQKEEAKTQPGLTLVQNHQQMLGVAILTVRDVYSIPRLPRICS